jgi:hypothetical protein
MRRLIDSVVMLLSITIVVCYLLALAGLAIA